MATPAGAPAGEAANAPHFFRPVDGIYLSDGPIDRTIAVAPHMPPVMARSVWRVEDFELHKELYRGKTSLLYQATDRRSGILVALKLYRKRKLSVLNRYQVEREIRIHIVQNHENIVKLYAAFEDEKHVYMVQEFAVCGDLFEDLKKGGGQLKEKNAARDVIAPFLSALVYLHAQSIVHRDIKPENILLGAGKVVKVADFGLSINVSHERPVTRAGTLDYMAPEVLVCPDKRTPEENKEKVLLGYTAQVDAWATGILAYELMVGYPPFEQESRAATYEHIMYKEPKFPAWMSEEAKRFINAALCKNATQRPTVQDLLQHPWLALHSSAPASSPSPIRRQASAIDYTQPHPRASNPVSPAPAVTIVAAPTQPTAHCNQQARSMSGTGAAAAAAQQQRVHTPSSTGQQQQQLQQQAMKEQSAGSPKLHPGSPSRMALMHSTSSKQQAGSASFSHAELGVGTDPSGLPGAGGSSAGANANGINGRALYDSISDPTIRSFDALAAGGQHAHAGAHPPSPSPVQTASAFGRSQVVVSTVSAPGLAHSGVATAALRPPPIRTPSVGFGGHGQLDAERSQEHLVSPNGALRSDPLHHNQHAHTHSGYDSSSHGVVSPSGTGTRPSPSTSMSNIMHSHSNTGHSHSGTGGHPPGLSRTISAHMAPQPPQTQRTRLGPSPAVSAGQQARMLSPRTEPPQQQHMLAPRPQAGVLSDDSSLPSGMGRVASLSGGGWQGPGGQSLPSPGAGAGAVPSGGPGGGPGNGGSGGSGNGPMLSPLQAAVLQRPSSRLNSPSVSRRNSLSLVISHPSSQAPGGQAGGGVGGPSPSGAVSPYGQSLTPYGSGNHVYLDPALDPSDPYYIGPEDQASLSSPGSGTSGGLAGSGGGAKPQAGAGVPPSGSGGTGMSGGGAGPAGGNSKYTKIFSKMWGGKEPHPPHGPPAAADDGPSFSGKSGMLRLKSKHLEELRINLREPSVCSSSAPSRADLAQQSLTVITRPGQAAGVRGAAAHAAAAEEAANMHIAAMQAGLGLSMGGAGGAGAPPSRGAAGAAGLGILSGTGIGGGGGGHGGLTAAQRGGLGLDEPPSGMSRVHSVTGGLGALQRPGDGMASQRSFTSANAAQAKKLANAPLVTKVTQYVSSRSPGAASPATPLSPSEQ